MKHCLTVFIRGVYRCTVLKEWLDEVIVHRISGVIRAGKFCEVVNQSMVAYFYWTSPSFWFPWKSRMYHHGNKIFGQHKPPKRHYEVQTLCTRCFSLIRLLESFWHGRRYFRSTEIPSLIDARLQIEALTNHRGPGGGAYVFSKKSVFMVTRYFNRSETYSIFWQVRSPWTNLQKLFSILQIR